MQTTPAATPTPDSKRENPNQGRKTQEQQTTSDENVKVE